MFRYANANGYRRNMSLCDFQNAFSTSFSLSLQAGVISSLHVKRVAPLTSNLSRTDCRHHMFRVVHGHLHGPVAAAC